MKNEKVGKEFLPEMTPHQEEVWKALAPKLVAYMEARKNSEEEKEKALRELKSAALELDFPEKFIEERILREEAGELNRKNISN